MQLSHSRLIYHAYALRPDPLAGGENEGPGIAAARAWWRQLQGTPGWKSVIRPGKPGQDPPQPQSQIPPLLDWEQRGFVAELDSGTIEAPLGDAMASVADNVLRLSLILWERSQDDGGEWARQYGEFCQWTAISLALARHEQYLVGDTLIFYAEAPAAWWSDPQAMQSQIAAVHRRLRILLKGPVDFRESDLASVRWRVDGEEWLLSSPLDDHPPAAEQAAAFGARLRRVWLVIAPQATDPARRRRAVLYNLYEPEGSELPRLIKYTENWLKLRYYHRRIAVHHQRLVKKLNAVRMSELRLRSLIDDARKGSRSAAASVSADLEEQQRRARRLAYQWDTQFERLKRFGPTLKIAAYNMQRCRLDPPAPEGEQRPATIFTHDEQAASDSEYQFDRYIQELELGDKINEHVQNEALWLLEHRRNISQNAMSAITFVLSIVLGVPALAEMLQHFADPSGQDATPGWRQYLAALGFVVAFLLTVLWLVRFPILRFLGRLLPR